jgi:hypothetical protein
VAHRFMSFYNIHILLIWGDLTPDIKGKASILSWRIIDNMQIPRFEGTWERLIFKNMNEGFKRLKELSSKLA